MDQDIAKVAEATPAHAGDADFLDGFISEEQYARQRGVTIRTCQRDRQLRKAPPYVKLGRCIFYRIEAVREWLIRNERAGKLVPNFQRARWPVKRLRRQRTEVVHAIEKASGQ